MKINSLLKFAIAFLIGCILVIIGAFFKIQHWPYGGYVLNIGMLLQVLAAFYVIIVFARQAHKN